jgi:hypothetical protein
MLAEVELLQTTRHLHNINVTHGIDRITVINEVALVKLASLPPKAALKVNHGIDHNVINDITITSLPNLGW